MFAHNRLDGFRGLVCVVEGNCGYIVVEDVSFDDSVEESTADEAEFAINGCGRSASEIPSSRFIVREGRIGVLEESDGNC
jgi:hypothetical protein